MAGALINDYSQTDSDILAVQLTLDATRIGLHQVSLTNYDSTSESQIAAGSIIEVNGGLYKFSANETITGSPSDGTVYIMIVPSTTTCTAQYTNTAPTWSDSKQGWYGTGASVNYRYLKFELTKSSTTWYKNTYTNEIRKAYYTLSFASGDASKSISHGITDLYVNKRLKNISYIIDYPTVSCYYQNNMSTSGVAVNTITISNTNLLVFRNTTGDVINVTVTLEYI